MATTPLQALPVPSLSDSPNGPAQFLALGTAVEKLVNMLFATVAARDAAVTAPVAGMVAYLSTPKWVTIYTGSVWVVMHGLTGIGASLARSTTQAVATGTLVDVTWPTETLDTDAFYPGGTTATITIPTGLGGTYNIAFNGAMSALTTARAMARITAGGDLYDFVFTTSDTFAGSLAIPLAAAATVKLTVFQSNGVSLNVVSAKLQVWRTGP